MNSREAHSTLNAARDGIDVSEQRITFALFATGDLTPYRKPLPAGALGEPWPPLPPAPSREVIVLPTKPLHNFPNRIVFEPWRPKVPA